MSSGRSLSSLDQIRANPTLHPLAFSLISEQFPDLKWHSHADDPRSSQAFAVSAFVPLLALEDKDTIIERFVTGVFPRIPHKEMRSWTVVPEFVDRDLLGETGAGIATNVDVLLAADDVVICVESKFIVDAAEGFGKCGQASKGTCLGYHGAGSDTRGTTASCRLAVKDGRRDPRRYWELGRGHFRDEVFAAQTPSQVCPFRDTYQLMRNYLLAAQYAEKHGKDHFAVVGIVPSARAAAILAGVVQFRERVLLPAKAQSVARVDYEDYIGLLAEGSGEANRLSVFLRDLL